MRISIHAPHGARRADMANYQVIFFEFQSTHHTGRDDICAVKLIFVYAFQSTHHTGRDSHLNTILSIRSNFNPRTTRGATR